MKKATNISAENGRLLRQLFEDILVALPVGAATLEARRTRDDRGTIVWLKPSNKNAAEFSGHTEDGSTLVDVSFGRGTTFELPWEANLPSDASFESILEAVKAMCLAVIAGKSQERLGLLGITGTIRVDEKRMFQVTRFFYPNLHPRIVRYAPY